MLASLASASFFFLKDSKVLLMYMRSYLPLTDSEPPSISLRYVSLILKSLFVKLLTFLLLTWLVVTRQLAASMHTGTSCSVWFYFCSIMAVIRSMICWKQKSISFSAAPLNSSLPMKIESFPLTYGTQYGSFYCICETRYLMIPS